MRIIEKVSQHGFVVTRKGLLIQGIELLKVSWIDSCQVLNSHYNLCVAFYRLGRSVRTIIVSRDFSLFYFLFRWLPLSKSLNVKTFELAINRIDLRQEMVGGSSVIHDPHLFKAGFVKQGRE